MVIYFILFILFNVRSRNVLSGSVIQLVTVSVQPRESCVFIIHESQGWVPILFVETEENS